MSEITACARQHHVNSNSLSLIIEESLQIYPLSIFFCGTGVSKTGNNAADIVITGDLIDLENLYRYRTSAINVETAVRASVTRVDVRADTEMRHIIAALARQQTVVTATRYGVSEDRTPQTAGTFIDRGIMFAMRGEYDKAVSDFDEAIRLKPDMAAAYMLRARALTASVSTVTEVEKNFSGMSTSINIGEQVSIERVRIYDRAIADYMAIPLS